MTDFETWKEFFRTYKIKFAEREYEDEGTKDLWNNSFCLETDNGEGYNGFTFATYFNKDGSFRTYGVWE